MVATNLRRLMFYLFLCCLSVREYTAQNIEVTGEIEKVITLNPQDCAYKNVNLWESERLMKGKRSVLEVSDLDVAVKVKEETRKLKVKHSTTNCRHHRKGMLNVECELRGVVPSSTDHNLNGHMPFTSDYHDPRTHPPKNN